ncbi:MAG: MMPL family transporter, partial [Oscillospiraceae bacterium]|nr:MMPL family transporter [Oscillospiraceae bacterium]
YCVICIPKVRVNNDITSYLDESTETKIGIDIMDSEFTTYGTAKVMVSNITYEKAESICDEINEIDNVKSVDFDDTEEHYNDSAALFSVTFDDDGESEESAAAMNEIRDMLSGYDTYISTEVGVDEAADMQKQMTVILAIALVIIILVLLYTSQTYAEVIVLLIVFGVAALMNKGTNYWFGEISFITDSIAVVLQLALAIDYAIILIHRFAEERETHDTREAIIIALSKAIIEISSSSLTTISGLIALVFMKLRVGMDMGLVLSKGIICSLISVFFLMPGLLLQFAPLLDKTGHKSLVPSISIWGKIVVKTRYIFSAIFIVSAAAGAVLAAKCPYAYDENSVRAGTQTEQSIADEKINDTFGMSNTMAVIVPKGDYESEARVLYEVGKLDRITSALGLANVEIDEDKDYTITDKIKPRDFSELMDMDYELVCLLYQAYGMKNENYAPIFGNVDDFGISMIDMVEFIKE